jgi:hypothetical protein
VGDCANTVKAFDDTVDADTTDATMKATKILDNVLLCISVSPNSTHLQYDDEHTYVPSPALKKFVYKPTQI